MSAANDNIIYAAVSIDGASMAVAVQNMHREKTV